MKITLPLILKKNRNGVGQAQQSNNVVARGLLDISLGSEEDIQTPVCTVDFCLYVFEVLSVLIELLHADFYIERGRLWIHLNRLWSSP